MSLTDQINQDIKSAMKAKDKKALEALRAIKSALLMAATDQSSKGSSEEELKMLQKLVKQRMDAAEIYQKEGRKELAEEEVQQAKIIENYLPEQLSDEEIKAKVVEIIAELSAASMADMGRVMAKVNQDLAGKADGKIVAQIVKDKLSSK